jgi:DNA-directed RNA polymerase
MVHFAFSRTQPMRQATARGVTDMIAIDDCIRGLACEMDVIEEAVREGFVKVHEARPLERFREAVLMALPDEEAREKLSPLPTRGKFHLRRALGSEYFFC